MTNEAVGTMTRAEKGPVAPPPALENQLQTIVNVVAAWPGVVTTVHWHFADRQRVDGVDFYLAEEELGHLHLDGEIHLASDPGLGQALIAKGAATAFRYLPGWVEAQAERIGTDAAIALFRSNYDRLREGV